MEMPFRPEYWTRFEFQGTPVYVRGDKTDWFVPNDAGDKILQTLSLRGENCLDITAPRFLARLPDEPEKFYQGRGAHLKTDHLREVWFHITDRPADRLHLQISVDGIGANHDHIRGRGAFAALQENLAWLRAQNLAFTVSMCVITDTVADSLRLADFAAQVGAANLHFLW